MKKKYESDILGVIHQSAQDLYEINAISEARMQEYDKDCLVSGLKIARKTQRDQAEAARLRLRGMFKTDGHDVDRFISWKQSERDIEQAIEQREDEESSYNV
jgi:hypothetical protein